jgi:cyclopropane-fatty-acyl-phospholipid synthase
MSETKSLGAGSSGAGDGLLVMAIELAERGWLPDVLIRFGIRRFAADRLRRQREQRFAMQELVDELRRSPIAVEVHKPNEQHYEVPPEFFQKVLGKRLKYSGCYWPAGITDLNEAERQMLRLTCERAEIEDGMEILDLGCGWGAFALWAAEHYPRSRIVAASNSAQQGRYIGVRCAQVGLANVEVVTADANHLSLPQRFDRVVSVEMFEHMRNYELLLNRIAGWLRANGQLFVHIFCHREHAYLYEAEGASDWMARWFFTGGIMPSLDLLPHFQKDLRLAERWFIDGTHYARTCKAWLRNLDAHADQIHDLFRRVYGPDHASRWVTRWRIFFLACAEVFACRNGQEWGMGHYRFRKP